MAILSQDSQTYILTWGSARDCDLLLHLNGGHLSIQPHRIGQLVYSEYDGMMTMIGLQ